MLAVYELLVPVLLLLLRMFSFFSPGLREFLRARIGLLDRWRAASLGEDRIWFHVASVGELEQVRPVIEALLQKKQYSIIVSYYSISVPRLVKDWGFVKFADFLPLDRKEDMNQLMEIVRPQLLVLNRYDIWPNHLLVARSFGVPVVVINASTPPLGVSGKLSLFFRWSLFQMVSYWTFVDSAAAAAWEPYVEGRVKALVTGDPRVDRALLRVEKLMQDGKAQDRIQRWKKEPLCLVAGSTWERDEDVLIAAWSLLKKEKKSLIIVPHEPTEAHLEKLEAKIKKFTFVRFSKLETNPTANILIVDQRGFLAELYGFGNLAYVGGGFGRHIHSIIEPVAHGIPVAFGPKYQRSPEALTLCATGTAFSLKGRNAEEDLARWIEIYSEKKESRARALESLRVFIQIHRGAGARVAEFLVACLKKS